MRSLGWEDPLEKEMATHSSILAWGITGTEEESGVLQSMGVTKSQTGLSNEHFHIIGWILILYDTCSYKKKIRPQKHTDGRLKEERIAIHKPWREASKEINHIDSWFSIFKIPEQ